jgi:molybdopterin/thiamine biosynthesis adenylyltransferase
VSAPPPQIAIVGAGGLGGPIALACAAAGARVSVCDPDRVELSNLQRQIQFATADVGRPKAEALAHAVRARGGEATGTIARFSAETADALAGDADVVVDASDDPATKFAVNDWAVARRKPYAIAAALQHHGSVMFGEVDKACYRCLFEAPPDDAPTCGDAGVLGSTVGAVGGFAAVGAMTLARDHGLGAGPAYLYVFDDLRARFEPRVVRFRRRAGCPACATATVH